MKTIRWGMIGCGDVTERKSGPGFRKAANSELVAVMRRNGPLARDYARRHGVPRWHDDADAIIRSPDIDAVYIATLTDSHCEYALLRMRQRDILEDEVRFVLAARSQQRERAVRAMGSPAADWKAQAIAGDLPPLARRCSRIECHVGVR